jgi:hypothetical protein
MRAAVGWKTMVVIGWKTMAAVDWKMMVAVGWKTRAEVDLRTVDYGLVEERNCQHQGQRLPSRCCVAERSEGFPQRAERTAGEQVEMIALGFGEVVAKGNGEEEPIGDAWPATTVVAEHKKMGKDAEEEFRFPRIEIEPEQLVFLHFRLDCCSRLDAPNQPAFPCVWRVQDRV